ncbi:hypothetical protein [Paenibacillus pabuli]|uniref:hypothetical protein n=1 Tax=Paenibacillus pabuli TaxID=1472 RepID=UPI000DB9D7AC|nr:hypothetical protein [Paenibacillus pabuli]
MGLTFASLASAFFVTLAASKVDHFYIDGDTGGLILAEHIIGNDKEMLELIVDRLSGMDALTFLTDVLLWAPDRVDMNLKLDRFQ